MAVVVEWMMRKEVKDGGHVKLEEPKRGEEVQCRLKKGMT